MLIETAEGVINTDHVVSAKPIIAPNGPDKCSISLANGSTAIVSVGIGAFEQACGVIVPARPGFTVIRAYPPSAGETETLYDEDPVIAFRIGHGHVDSAPVPITAGGEPLCTGGRIWTVRQPNGRCIGPDDEFDDIATFKVFCETFYARAA